MNDETLGASYYSHSGRAPAGGLVVAIAVGALVASPFALVYAYFDVLIPFVCLNIVGAVVVGRVKAPRVLEAHGFDDAELKRRLESEDFAYIAALGQRKANDLEWFGLDLHRATGVTTRRLTAKSMDLTGEGRRASETTVLEKLIVSQAEVEQLRSFKFDPPASVGAQGRRWR